jgi:NAD(P) transhydrogenase
VPSKTLRETALSLSGIRSRDLYGVDLSLRREATVADLMRREHAVKEALNRTLAQIVEASSVELIVGDERFPDRKTFTAATRHEVAEDLTAALRDRDRGINIKPGKQTIGEFLATWLRTR